MPGINLLIDARKSVHAFSPWSQKEIMSLYINYCGFFKSSDLLKLLSRLARYREIPVVSWNRELSPDKNPPWKCSPGTSGIRVLSYRGLWVDNLIWIIELRTHPLNRKIRRIFPLPVKGWCQNCCPATTDFLLKDLFLAFYWLSFTSSQC